MKDRRVHNMTPAARRYRLKVLAMLDSRIAAHELRGNWTVDETSKLMLRVTRELREALGEIR